MAVATIVPEMGQAGVDYNAAHPCLEWPCAGIAINLREYFEESIAEHRFRGRLIISIAQAYLQEIAVIRPENMFLRFAVCRAAAGYDIRRQNGFQSIKFC